MASRAPWSADELAVLESHIDQPDWLGRAAAKIHGRTMKSLKVRMAKLRAELGLEDGRSERGCGDDMDAFNAKAVAASRELLAAIERAGVRP